jgi:hypothetical protein
VRGPAAQHTAEEIASDHQRISFVKRARKTPAGRRTGGPRHVGKERRRELPRTIWHRRQRDRNRSGVGGPARWAIDLGYVVGVRSNSLLEPVRRRTDGVYIGVSNARATTRSFVPAGFLGTSAVFVSHSPARSVFALPRPVCAERQRN